MNHLASKNIILIGVKRPSILPIHFCFKIKSKSLNINHFYQPKYYISLKMASFSIQFYAHLLILSFFIVESTAIRSCNMEPVPMNFGPDFDNDNLVDYDSPLPPQSEYGWYKVNCKEGVEYCIEATYCNISTHKVYNYLTCAKEDSCDKVKWYCRNCHVCRKDYCNCGKDYCNIGKITAVFSASMLMLAILFVVIVPKMFLLGI